MVAPSPRLQRRVHADFGPGADAVLVALHRVPDEFPGAGSQDGERVQAAVVLGSHGDARLFAELLTLGLTDWRDLLVAGNVADQSWRAVLDAELGPVRRRDR